MILFSFTTIIHVPLNALSAVHLVVQLNKSSTSNLQGSTHLGSKSESTVPSLSAGVASRPAATSTSSGPVANTSIFPSAAAATYANPPASSTSAADVATLASYEAVRRAQELAARMGFRQDPQFAPLINMFPGQMVTDVTIPQKPTKAPVLRLDAQGREIDEHGNVVNVTKPSNLSTLKVCSCLNCLFLSVIFFYMRNEILSLTRQSVSEHSRSTLTNRRKTHLKY